MGITASKCTPVSLALCFLALFLCSLQGSAPAQSRPPTSTSKTVSVASLAVPAKAREHLEKARRALMKGNEEEYDREMGDTLAISPRFADAYLLRASRELLRDHYTAAIDEALTAQRLEPSIHWATIIHAIACNQLKLFAEASTLLDRLAPREMDTWQAIYEKTRAAVGTGDTDAALRWSERALGIVPQSRVDDTVLLRGDALLMAHRWQEAVTQFQTYLHSPRPQPKRAEVLALLERIPQLSQGDSIELIAANPQ